MAPTTRKIAREKRIVKSMKARQHDAAVSNAPPTDQDTGFADRYHGARVHVEDVIGVGAASYGGSAAAWITELGTWPKSMLDNVLQNPLIPANVKAAARRVLDSMKSGFIGGKEFDRCCDRTVGKPHQSTKVTVTRDVSAADLLAEARALIPNSHVSAQIVANDADKPRIVDKAYQKGADGPDGAVDAQAAAGGPVGDLAGDQGDDAAGGGGA